MPKDFPQLDALTISELEDLVSEDQVLTDFVENKIETVSQMRVVQTQLMESVKKLASVNMATEAEMTQLQKENAQLRQGVEAKQLALNELFKRQQAVLGRYSTAAVLQRLDTLINQQEGTSSDFFRAFRDQSDDDSESSSSSSESDSDDAKSNKKKKKSKKETLKSFCKKYPKLRKDVHILQAKKERLQQIYI